MAANDSLTCRLFLIMFVSSAACWSGCGNPRDDVRMSSQAQQVLAQIDNMSQSLARGQVVCELNSQLAAEMTSINNRGESAVLLARYEDAIANFTVSQMKPDYDMLSNAWRFKDLFRVAHQTVCAVSSNQIDGIYFTLKLVARLESEAKNLDARLRMAKSDTHSEPTGSGPDLSERGCLIACARGLRDDAKSLVYQYIDMPRHLFDEYTQNCSTNEKNKIVSDIENTIGRAPKFF